MARFCARLDHDDVISSRRLDDRRRLPPPHTSHLTGDDEAAFIASRDWHGWQTRSGKIRRTWGRIPARIFAAIGAVSGSFGIRPPSGLRKKKKKKARPSRFGFAEVLKLPLAGPIAFPLVRNRRL